MVAKLFNFIFQFLDIGESMMAKKRLVLLMLLVFVVGVVIVLIFIPGSTGLLQSPFQ
jgi:hypothetical protein